MFKVITAIIIVLMAQVCMAATIYVPADSATIQAGINGAVPGDTVLVAPGTYTGAGNRDMSFDGKNIVVMSEEGPEVTIIDLQGSSSEPHRAFNFLFNETSAAELVGFTIINGYGTWSHSHYEGGAMLIENASPTIKYCVFANNDGVHQGGAVSCFTSSPTFINCTFVGNAASYGGGIYSNGASPVLENCIIAFSTIGSAANCIYGGTVSLVCCDLYGNADGDYVDCAAGQLGVNGNISADPEFADTSANDYVVIFYSPCSPFINLDCGLIGALEPADTELPLAIHINYGPGSSGNQVYGDTPEFYWTYFDTAATSQQQYEIEVGTDQEWTVAEMWDSGPVMSTDTFATYAGLPLVKITMYYVRIRVHSGTNWGSWHLNWFIIRPNIISVPAMAPTIQAGIDMTSNDDTVLVAPGTYTGPGNRDIDFGGRRILLISENGLEETIIDCQGNEFEPHRAFSFTNGEDSSSIVEGFTVIGGYGQVEIAGSVGGAVYCMQSSPTFMHCVFNGNTGYSFGGAIAAFASSPGFHDCSFDSNYADYGGAVYLVGSAPSGARQTYSPVFDNCDFNGNSANVSSGYGGAIYCHLGDMQLTMTYCLIANNSGYSGGAIAVESIANVELINCTFAYNSAPNGAGLFLDGSTIADLQNNIIAFNESGEGVFCDDLVYLDQLICNDIYGNDGGDTVLCILPQTEVFGNFSLDPRFCEPDSGNYGIRYISPCANNNNDCDVLIGSEEIGCGPVCGDANDDGVVNVSDVVKIINYVFVGGSPPVPLACGDSNGDGTVNVSDAVKIIGYIFIGGGPPGDCAPGSGNWLDGDCPPFN